jgi:hypothetical protein
VSAVRYGDAPDVIGVRELLYSDDDGREIPVHVRLHKPVRSRVGVACAFDVCDPDGRPIPLRQRDGTELEIAETVWAKDDLGAIQGALEALRVSLKPVRERLSFDGVRGSGLSMTITALSYKMERHLEQLVDNETASIRSRLEDPSTRGEALQQIRDDEPHD